MLGDVDADTILAQLHYFTFPQGDLDFVFLHANLLPDLLDLAQDLLFFLFVGAGLLLQHIFHIECGNVLHQGQAALWELSSFEGPELLEEGFLFAFDELVDDFILVCLLLFHYHVEVDVSFLDPSD